MPLPFGGNSVGPNAAAWRYFGDAPEAPSWAESATLAVQPNQPGLCDTRAVRVPLGSHCDRRSPHHRWLHLSTDGATRVHDGCASPGRMQHRAWFVLSPAQAMYYRREHPDHRPMPPWRADFTTDADGCRRARRPR
jgi:membrane carboxypeptidase/penicillin-binding protein PbpC